MFGSVGAIIISVTHNIIYINSHLYYYACIYSDSYMIGESEVALMQLCWHILNMADPIPERELQVQNQGS